jgi:hypothetical protein
LALGFALISTGRIKSAGAEDIPVVKAHGGDTLFINGNRDNFGVTFAHEEHVRRLGDKESCVLCHHMNLPLDANSGCYNCHSRMYTASDVFGHDWHASAGGANLVCNACHDENTPRTAETARECRDCHNDLFPQNATIEVLHYDARSHTDAMHGQCLTCHREKALTVETGEDLPRCATCHKTDMPEYLPSEIEMYFRDTTYNHLAVPHAVETGQKEEESAI